MQYSRECAVKRTLAMNLKKLTIKLLFNLMFHHGKNIRLHRITHVSVVEEIVYIVYGIYLPNTSEALLDSHKIYYNIPWQPFNIHIWFDILQESSSNNDMSFHRFLSENDKN